jgi:hypothetical protein
MYEYEKDKNPSNSSSGSITSNSFITTSSSPRIKRVVVTETTYDEEGRVVKEVTTETEYTDGGTWYQPYSPQPWQYPYITYTTATASG